MTLYRQVLRLSSQATDHEPLQIISPYITVNPIRALLRHIGPSAKIELTTCFEQELFLDGASSLGALSLLARRNNSKVYAVPRLHAKAYICGDSALVGSANCTDRGLGYSGQSNVELLCIMDSCREEIVGLIRMLESSREKLYVADIDSMISSVALVNTRTRSTLRNRLDAILHEAEWIPSCSLKYLLKYLAEGSFYRIPADSRKPILKDAQYLEIVLGKKILGTENDVLESISVVPIVQLAIESELRKSRFLQKCMAAKGVPGYQIDALNNWAKHCLMGTLKIG